MRSPGGWHFASLRVALGLFLAFHFLWLRQYAAELFSREGVLPAAELNPTYGWFPNPLYVLDTPFAVESFLAGLALLALLLAAGVTRRSAALLLWFGLACLYHRNNLIDSPFHSYLGWLLLMVAAIPPGEGLSPRRLRPRVPWSLPPVLFAGAWIVLALSYTTSGVHKWATSPSWRAGEALATILASPLARDTEWVRAAAALPPALLHAATWAACAIEALFAPFALWARTRPWIWLLATGMHVGVLLTLNMTELSLAMLLFHAFVFDASWLDGLRRRRRGATAPDP